jgi:hypothetical protein
MSRGVALVAVLAATVTTLPATAQTEDVKTACLAAYEQAQVARNASKFADARVSLRACAQEQCPGLVRTDCVEWLADLEKLYPSVVYDAYVDGRQVLDAHAYADGALVTDHIDGRAIPMEPGRHVFRIEVPGFPASEQVIVLSEGVHGRVIAASFEHPRVDVPSRPWRTTYRPVPLAVWISSGVAATAAISLAVFGGFALSEKSHLENTCRPFCSDHQMAPLRIGMGGADISLGLAVAAALTGGALFFLRPDVERPTQPSLSVTTASGGGMLSFEGRY